MLIFEDFKSNLTAKIADFGSSLFRSSITKLMKVQSGTTLWQPRWVTEMLDGSQLIRADIYSLGLVLWRVLLIRLMGNALDVCKGPEQSPDEYLEHLKGADERNVPPVLPYIVHCSFIFLGRRWSNEVQQWKLKGKHPGTTDERHVTEIEQIFDTIGAVIASALSLSDADLQCHHLLIRIQTIKTRFDLWRSVWPMKSISELRPFDTIDLGLVQIGPWAPYQTPEEQMEWGMEFVAECKLIRNPGPIFQGLRQLIVPKLEVFHRWLPVSIHIGPSRLPRSNAEVPSRDTTKDTREDLSGSSNTLTLGLLEAAPLSSKVTNTIIQAAMEVVDNGEEDIARRVMAAWQIALFGLHHIGCTAFSGSLEFLRLAAIGGHLGAQCIVCHVFDTFGEKLDGFSVEELESLRKGVSLGHGSWIAKRRLRQLLSKESISPPGPGPRISTEFIDAEQEPALLHACKLGLHDAVIQLLKDSADASVANRHGTTALHYLGSFDDEHIPDICKRLIEAGATTKARSEERRQQEPFVGIIQIAHINQTPLMWAVIADNKVAVEVLVAGRANPFHPTSETKYSPQLVEAAQHRQHEILRILLSETAI